MSHDDHDVEPIPGLPELPPAGEKILWQGSPHWPTIARRVMHLDVVAVYLALLVGWRLVSAIKSGQPVGDILFVMLPVMAVGFAVLALIAYGIGRTTVYTITNRRVAMRFGMALPVTFNLPFKSISAAGVRDLGRGRGDIALQLTGSQRLAYLVLWPHVRPWRVRTPEPMLRALPDASKIAALLGDALASEVSQPRAIAAYHPANQARDRSVTDRPAMIAAE